MTFTLCTVSDAAKTLTEIRRVLKPGGVLLFAEHGRAPEIGVARWQDRLTPIWKRVAGGCHLNRKPDDLMQSAGWRPVISKRHERWGSSIQVAPAQAELSNSAPSEDLTVCIFDAFGRVPLSSNYVK
jgi:SAM-dependent methyltransferase